MPPRILHLDIDAFFASVEQVRNRRLRGKPVIVGSGVIASCSYEARRFGLHAGMNLTTAKQRCPAVIILAGNYPVYHAFADQVWDICHRLAPAMETLLDDAYLDLSGTERLYGHLRLPAEELKTQIHRQTGLQVTLGAATSRTVARLVSAWAKPDGLGVVEPGREIDFLRDLPVEKLPGVGRATADVLRKLNITTIGALGQLPPRSLESLFGANGLALHERAHGRDTCPINAGEIPRTISRETSFHRDTIDRQEIEAMLYYLTEQAAKTLRELGLQVRSLAVKIRYSDGAGERSSKRLPRPSDLDSEIFDWAQMLLERVYRRRVSLHGVGVVFVDLARAGPRQGELFESQDPRHQAQLYRAIDSVRRRYGYGSLVAAKSIDLINALPRDDYGFILRTPSLTK